MRIRVDRFAGMRPRVEPHLLQDPEAQNILDAALETGAVAPAAGLSVVKALTKTTPQALFRINGTVEADHWLEFNQFTSVIRSPVIGDIHGRVYWTDANGARYAPQSLALSGGSFPGGSWSLGVPAPTAIPIAASFTAGVDPNLESRAYTETFVTAYGEEGPNGPVSAIYDVDPRDPVTVNTLTPVPTPPPGKAWNITHRRLYRTSFTGGISAAFQLVAELPVANLSFVDNVPQESLGKVLDSEGFDSPPDGAYGITVTESGMVVLLKDFEVYLSENSLPHAYNLDYVQRLQHRAVAAASFAQVLAVMTTGDLYVGQGLTPAGTQLVKIDGSQPCLSAAGVAVTRGGAYYPGPDGLNAIGTDMNPVLVTREMFTQQQWLALNPASFVATIENGRYRAWFTRQDGSRGQLIIDPTGRTAPLVMGTQKSGEHVSAAYRDPSSDIVYLASGTQLRRINKAPSTDPWTWRSKEFRFTQPVMLSAFLVRGEGSSLTFRAYRNGALYVTKTLPFGAVGRFPTSSRGERWVFEVTSSGKMTELVVAPSVEELFE